MGELAGFCVPALVGGLLREEPPLLVLGAMVLAGLVEGAVLGWSQSRVLRHRLSGRRLRARRDGGGHIARGGHDGSGGGQTLRLG